MTSFWQQQQLLQPPDLLAVPPALSAGCAHHIAEAHVQSFSFIVGSTASRVGATASFVSTALWIWLGTLALFLPALVSRSTSFCVDPLAESQ